MNYGNIYYRQNESSITRRTSDIPGWFATQDNNRALLGDYRRALADGTIINRSKEAVAECREYVYLASGRIAHARSVSNMDPSGARENHGDRVRADALLVRLQKDVQQESPGDSDPTAPPGSYAFRRELVEAERRTRDAWW